MMYVSMYTQLLMQVTGGRHEALPWVQKFKNKQTKAVETK